jgi:hypothetical protein
MLRATRAISIEFAVTTAPDDDARRFSRWFTAEQAPPADTPGLVQIKLAAELLPYPRGRSAMLWYGAGRSLPQTLSAGLGLAAERWPVAHLRWRYLASTQPDPLLAELLDRFVRRFGAPPALTPR